MDSLKYDIHPLHLVKNVLRLLMVVFIIVGNAWAEPPQMTEGMVYRLRLFNGKGHTDSFCPESEETVYLIADAHNILLPKMTLVYFWATTRRLQASFKTLDEGVEGTLEILRNGKVIDGLKKRDYALYFAEGWYSETSRIFLDEKAHEKYEEYKQTRDTFHKRHKEYEEKQRQYQNQLKDFYAKIKEREKPQPKSEHPERIPVPKEPLPPVPPGYYMQKPEEGYIINLPVGEYAVRLRADDGSIVEGSEKKIVSFTHRRSGKIGYEIIPAKRWTMPEISSTTSEAIYMVGKHTLYFKPYVQNEYNHLYYSKLLDPQNEGHPERWLWVNIKQVEEGTLQLVGEDQSVTSIQEKPYFVRQIAGPELGYSIIEYDKEKFSNQSPSFVGYKVAYDPKMGNCRVRLASTKDQVLSGSLRKLRTVEPGRIRELYILSVVLPLVIGFSIIARRRWKLRRYRVI